MARPVLRGRPVIEQERADDPDDEADRRADQPAAHVQIDFFTVQVRVALAGPHVQVFHAQRDGDEQDRHRQDHPRRALEQPADGEAPRAAREVLEHEKPARAHRKAEPEQVRIEVRAEELLALTDEEAEKQQRAAGDARDQRGDLDAVERRVKLLAAGRGGGCGDGVAQRAPPAAGAGAVLGAVVGAASAAVSLLWSSWGNAFMSTFWLNWSTRMYAAIAQRSSTETLSLWLYIAPQPFVITS